MLFRSCIRHNLELLCGVDQVSIIHLRKLLDLPFHFRRTVGTAQVLDDVNLLFHTVKCVVDRAALYLLMVVAFVVVMTFMTVIMAAAAMLSVVVMMLMRFVNMFLMHMVVAAATMLSMVMYMRLMYLMIVIPMLPVFFYDFFILNC